MWPECSQHRAPGRTGLRGGSRRGFTLVELLVVIGIIALLISTLLPALNKARLAGQAVTCMSNLRQIGTAHQLYINDNDGYIVPAAINGHSGGPPYKPSYTWDSLLAPYYGLKLRDSDFSPAAAGLASSGLVRAPRLIQCPTDPLLKDHTGGQAGVSYSMVSARSSYGPNGNHPSGKPRYFWTGAIRGLSGPGTAASPPALIKITQVQGTSETFMMSECPNSQSTFGYAYSKTAIDSPQEQLAMFTGTVGYHPGGKLNYLHADGHVEALPPYETLGTSTTLQLPKGRWTRTRGD